MSAAIQLLLNFNPLNIYMWIALSPFIGTAIYVSWEFFKYSIDKIINRKTVKP